MLNGVKKDFKCGVKALRKLAGWKDSAAEIVLLGGVNPDLEKSQ